MMHSDSVTSDLDGYGLTTAQILYRMPDRLQCLQEFIWQQYDVFPRFPALQEFLIFWQREIDGPLFSVTVAHKQLVRPSEVAMLEGTFQLH